MTMFVQWIITDGDYTLDGGTTTVYGHDATGQPFTLTLIQHMFLEPIDPKRLPGRLYYNEALVPIRSELEHAILTALHTSTIVLAESPIPPGGEPIAMPRLILGEDIAAIMDSSEADNVRRWCQSICTFVQSEDYIHLASTRSLGESDHPTNE